MSVPTVLRYALTGDLLLDSLLAAYRAWLDEHERCRLSRLRRVADRREYVAAHALLRTTLAEITGVPAGRLQLTADRAGRPALRNGGPPFTLTHCQGLVACAVGRAGAGHQVGVDAEPLRSAERLAAMVDSFAGRGEREWLHRRGHAARLGLVQLWTAKEAVLKARGTGLAMPDGRDALRALHCDFSRQFDGRAICVAAGEEYAVHCWQLASDHVLAFAEASAQGGNGAPVPEAYRLGVPAHDC